MAGHGGARKGAGRKPKIQELELIEKLDNIIKYDDVIEKLKGLINDNNFNAIKLYLEYRFGKPKETVNSNVNFENISLKDLVKFDNSK